MHGMHLIQKPTVSLPPVQRAVHGASPTTTTAEPPSPRKTAGGRCVQAQPSLRQPIAEDPRLPLLETPISAGSLARLGDDDPMLLTELLCGVRDLNPNPDPNPDPGHKF